MERDTVIRGIWYAVATVAVIFLLQTAIVANRVSVLSYSDFKILLKAGKLDNVIVSEQEITGTIRDNKLDNLLSKEKTVEIEKRGVAPYSFDTVRVADPKLVEDLQGANVHFEGQIESHWLGNLISWILPAAIFVGIWIFGMKRLTSQGMGTPGGLLDIGKSHAKLYMEAETGITFADVAGISEAKEELMEIVDFLKNPDRFRRLGGKIPKGVLIVGAPGTGKTLLAKAVAGEAGVPFFTMSGSEFVEMFVGVGAARVRDLFSQAQAKAPCIIFIDELDALGRARGVAGFGGHEEREQTLNQLLVQMDGFDANRGVIIMAATNRPEILDPALLRPGRFDRHIALDRPDLNGRLEILQVHVRKVKLAPQLDLREVAAKTTGFAGADLANLVNEAALLAARQDKDYVDGDDFDHALDRIVGGLEKKNRVLSPIEKETIAYHEAGHALIAESRKHADKVSKISIVPRGVAALGFTQQTPTEDRYLLKMSELLDRLDVLLGGRVAEELKFGDVSTGAQNDLQRATDLARQMVTQFGMSDALGLASLSSAPASPYLQDGFSGNPREYSEATAREIDKEINRILDQSHARVTASLKARLALLEQVAHLLLEKEVVDGDTLRNMIAQAGVDDTAPLALAQA